MWIKYVDRLEAMAQPAKRDQAVGCLNELVTDALQHIPDVFAYIKNLRNPTVINFCAIPQVMAIATLAECYDNPRVFSGVVKIRKSLAVCLMLEAASFNSLCAVFDRYADEISLKVLIILFKYLIINNT